MWGAGCCPAGSVVLACAVVPAAVLAGGGVLAACCCPCCCVRVCCCPCCCVPAGCVCPCCLVVMERMNNKTSIPTQNIIYPHLKGGYIILLNPYRKRETNQIRLFPPLLAYASNMSQSTFILVIKSSTSFVLSLVLLNSTFICPLDTYCVKSLRNK